MQPRTLAERAARWSAGHRRIAILGWLALVVVSVLMAGAVGQNLLADEDLGSGESREADRILADAGFADRASEQILIQPRGGQALTVDDPRFTRAIEDVVVRLRRFDTVADVKDPLVPQNAGQISRDRRSALVAFDIRGDDDLAEERVVPIQEAIAGLDRTHPALRIEQFGDASADKAISDAFEDDFRKAEVLSLPITLIILVLAFGALVAAGIPLLLGISAVVITLGLLAPISQLFPVDQSISSVILLVGLAVGVDYSLFYLRRERDERAAGRDPEAALFLAAATSGRAVLVSGCTVMVAMAGMYITANPTFSSFATGTILVVAVAVAGSLTVLPATLSKLGDNVNRGRIPFVSRLHKGGAESGFWARIVGAVMRRPLVAVILAGGALVLLALPTLRLHTANSGVQGLPRDLPVMQTYERIQEAFPGGPLPAVVAVRAPDVRALEVTAAIRDMRDRAVATGQFRDPLTVTNDAGETVALVTIAITGGGTDDRSNDALLTLREDVIPQSLGRLPGVEAKVTGLTAGSYDFNQLMKERAPWVFLFVLSLAFVLLMVTFRSIVIPIKAIVLNLLSVFAAYGVLVLIFQDGRLESLIGFTSIGGITSWLPLFLFVILFGLSMDYHVFILSRVREGYDGGMPTEEAVSHGIRATAGVVTSAAAVMVGVFSIFGTLSAIDFKEMGVGLAVAVLIDATIVRAVLLPATMKLLGDWNWYLPSWLEWLPRVSPEAAAPGPPPPAASAAEAAEAAEVAEAAAVAEAPAPGALRMTEEARDGTTWLSLAGELDLRSADDLRRRFEEVEASAATLVVDLRGLTFLDSRGLSALVAAHRRARAAGRRLVLVRNEQTPIAEILHMTAVDRMVETTDAPPRA
jgi:RND superfamily putative drug exporter